MLLPIIEIPRRRKFLTIGIAVRVRELFGRDRSRSLPVVRFFTDEELRRKRRRLTSYYDFANGEVGLYYNTKLDLDTLWERLAWHSLHEHLHWSVNFSPLQSGARDSVDCKLFNIAADAANEQRAGLVSDWCRGIVRRGRAGVVADELVGPLPTSPLWAAAFLSLRAHTFLAARGWRLLERASSSAPDDAAGPVWAAIEPLIGAPPAGIGDRWPEAWRLLWGAWRADNQHVVFDAVRRLRELFPESADDDAPDGSPSSADDHPGSGEDHFDEHVARKKAERDDVKGDSKDEASSSIDAEDDDRKADRSGVDEETSEADPTPAPTVEELSDAIDSETTEEQTEEPIATEVAEFLADARMWEPLKRRRPETLPEDVSPESGAALLARAEPQAAELARQIEAIEKPSVRREGTRGRARAGVVARTPDHPRPFRERVREERALAPGVFVATMVDTSGSMSLYSRIDAAREAAMALTLACERTRTASVTVTSRGLIHVAGDSLPPHRAAALLAGIHPNDDEGFPWTLRPFLEEVAASPEPVRVVVVVMDGMPVGAASLVPVIAEFRKRGLNVIGLGLDLNPSEAAGLVKLFGKDAVLAERARFARSLASVVSSAIARAVR